MIDRNDEFRNLVTQLIEGSADREATDELSSMCVQHPHLREEYAEQFQTHAMLHWQQATTPPAEVQTRTMTDTLGRSLVTFQRSLGLIAAIAATVVIAVGMWLVARPGYYADIEVLVANNVVSTANFPELREHSQVHLRHLSIDEGRLLFRTPEGTDIRLVAPARLEFLGPEHVRLNYGKLTALVAKGARQLTVETDQTDILDLGTVFGVDVVDLDRTDVVVFEGMVEVRDRIRRPGQVARTFLHGGEAARVDNSHRLSRITNVVGLFDDGDWCTEEPSRKSLFLSVSDNLRNPGGMFYYRTLPKGLREDVGAYVARRHQWNGLTDEGLPQWLLGADLVQTLSSYKYNPQLEIEVKLARRAKLYVFFDSRSIVPEWLAGGFADTKTDIGLEMPRGLETGIPMGIGPGEGHLLTFRVWERDVEALEAVTLGAVPQAEPNSSTFMYGFAAKELPAPKRPGDLNLAETPTSLCIPTSSYQVGSRSFLKWFY